MATARVQVFVEIEAALADVFLEIETAMADVAGNLEGLANSGFVWCDHPHGHDAVKRFAHALRENAARLRYHLEEKKEEKSSG